MYISDHILYVGVNDTDIDLFEGQYKVPHGMSYNSYIIKDEKTAVFDTVDARKGDEWLSNISAVLGGKRPDYLIIQHMEPDHSASIARFLEAYPDTCVVGNAKTFAIAEKFFGSNIAPNRQIVRDTETLCLGTHTLHFVFAPMVHWPEVMVTYEESEKVLFSADAFGRFGTPDAKVNWADEARRYYFGIVGKYGTQVTSLLKKAASLEIKTICPLHGPVLNDPTEAVELYSLWSSYKPEKHGVLIAYTSVYGNTKKVVTELKNELETLGAAVEAIDLARSDMSNAVAEAFRNDKLVLATTTYNADIFPFMRDFIDHLTERGYKNRTIGLIENGSWAPRAAQVMREMLSGCAVTFAEPVVTINSSSDEASAAAVTELAKVLAKAEHESEDGSGSQENKPSGRWQCSICGYVYEGDELPADFKCPLCKRGAEFFKRID